MAIGDLVDTLERTAAAEADQLLAGARAEAERLQAAAEGYRKRELSGECDRYRATHQVQADIQIAQAALQWRGQVLAERARSLERLREATRAELPALLAGPDGERLATLLVDAALAAAGDGPAVLRCPPALAELVRARAGDRAQLQIEVDAATGAGVQIDADGGRLRIDATLEAMLERLWPRLRLEVAAPGGRGDGAGGNGHGGGP